MSGPPTKRGGRPEEERPAGYVYHDAGDTVTRELAYEAGFMRALTLAAERVDELNATWRRFSRPTYEEKVAARIAETERHSRELHAKLGHPAGYVYNGGPVDWETGAPR